MFSLHNDVILLASGLSRGAPRPAGDKNMCNDGCLTNSISHLEITMILGAKFLVSMGEGVNKDLFDRLRHPIEAIPRVQIMPRPANTLKDFCLKVIDNVDKYMTIKCLTLKCLTFSLGSAFFDLFQQSKWQS